MKFFVKSVKAVLGLILERPGTAAGIAVFGLGFTLVAGNALYYQEGTHPDPIWSTAKEQDSLSLQSVQPAAKTSAQSQSITRSVLTQRISLKNVPVPKANPARSKKISSQSTMLRDVQQVLADIGLYEGKVDGIYGTATRNAIIKFQKQAGVIPNGEASYGLLNNLKSVQAVTAQQSVPVQNTIAQPKPSPRPVATTEPESSNTASINVNMITRVQAGLKENFGIENISVDGVMGNQTKNAIRYFQEKFKLEANGELNQETISKMKSVGVLTSI